MRSLSVVLPESICAEMPKLRTLERSMKHLETATVTVERFDCTYALTRASGRNSLPARQVSKNVPLGRQIRLNRLKRLPYHALRLSGGEPQQPDDDSTAAEFG